MSTAPRKYLHSNPELSYKEINTSKYIIDKLTNFGFKQSDLKTEIGGTGIIATLDTGRRGKVIALRADMDGLPITEETNLPYQSKNKNVMHACGHDGHMAILLMVAKTLQDHKKDLNGVYKLIFQPAEEGGKGAEKIIAAGALKNPKVDFVFGLHGWPEKKGSISVRPGAQMAGATIFDIFIEGKGGHAALPHKTVNPIIVSSHIISLFENLIHQKDPTNLQVLNITYIKSGTTYNVVPDNINLKGTLRTVSTATQAEVLNQMKNIIDNSCEIFGCNAKLKQSMSYPATINTKKEVDLILTTAKELYPDNDEMVFIREYPVLPSEDFSLYLQEVPGSFFFLGQGNDVPGLHSSKFNFDDKTIKIGAYMLFKAAIASNQNIKILK